MKPGGKAAAADRRRKMSEKRAAERLQKILYADVRGKHSTFRGMLTNISRTGALLTITDQRFELLIAHGDLSLAGLLIASHFGDGLTIELLEKPVKIPADVVRIYDESSSGRPVMWLGCHFREELSHEACVAVGLKQAEKLPELPVLPPPPPPAAPSAPAGPDIDPRIRVKIFDEAKPAGSIRAVATRAAEDRAAAAPAPLGKARVFRTGAAIGLREILQMAVDRGATDVHVKAASPVRVRAALALAELGDRPLEPVDAEALVREALTPEQFEELQTIGDVDAVYTLEGGARFRVNAYRTRKAMGLAIRRIPDKPPTLEGLGLAQAVGALALRPKGLVLIAGAAGSGRTTTLAAMVHHVNQARACHIVTIEDPIEIHHRDAKAQVTQREIGDDAEDFPSAIRCALRQDPDVIVVGEMRDAETVRLAVAAAEAGNLVLAAVTGGSAILAPDRIVDLFPADQQRQARLQLSEVLQGVVAQALLPKVGGGAVLAQEILVATGAIRALVREAKTAQLLQAMQSKDGAQTLEGSLNDLIARGLITYETALARAHQPKLIEREGRRL
jgi:twitching motility protein PilT